jgi:hypothetical protein
MARRNTVRAWLARAWARVQRPRVIATGDRSHSACASTSGAQVADADRVLEVRPLTLADRLLATVLHHRHALPQITVAALFGVRPNDLARTAGIIIPTRTTTAS